jgi:N-acetylmuramoyl-L-alanine amidase
MAALRTIIMALLIAATLSFGLSTRVSAEESSFNDEQVRCVASAVYHEARGTSMTSMRAVAHVVVNRSKSGKFPTTPCGVVRQKLGRVCQFSFYCARLRVHDLQSYRISEQVAEQVMGGDPDPTSGATYFHATRVRAGWSGGMKRTLELDGQAFYADGG